MASFDVKVTIDLTKPIGKVGFGMPLLLVENAAEAVEYTVVSNPSEIVAAGFTAESDVYKAAQLLFMQNHSPKKIAVCAVTGTAAAAMADVLLVNKDWRHLIVINEGEDAANYTELITAFEALDGKLLFIGLPVDDSTSITVTGLRRTVLFYCDPTDEYPVPVAALVGEIAGRTAGSFTYKNLVLSGITAQELTDTQLDNIHKKGGITFISKAGDNVTSEGMVAGGEYIDVIDTEDYIVQQLAYKTQKLLNNAAKVPFDNNGIAMLESVAVDVLQGAFNDGLIAIREDGSPDYTVQYALNEDCNDKDRANRRYLGGSFAFRLAGAIHYAEITGTITA